MLNVVLVFKWSGSQFEPYPSGFVLLTLVKKTIVLSGCEATLKNIGVNVSCESTENPR